MSKMTRRSWFQLVCGGAAAATALSACGNKASQADAPGPDSPAGCGVTDAKTIIADNHAHAPHAVSVTVADVAAAADKTYSIMGMANHDHMITITAAQFGTLKMGGTIMVTSTVTLCHMHVVTVSCG